VTHVYALPVLAVHALASLRTSHSLLKTLAVVLQAPRLRTLTAPLRPHVVQVVPVRVGILAVDALAVSAAHESVGKALAVLRPTFAFGALAFYLSLVLGLLAAHRQQVIYFALV